MVKDLLLEALRMLGLTEEDDVCDKDTDLSKEFLRCYNLVVSELFDRDDSGYATAPTADDIEDDSAVFNRISDRVICYGIAAEYCITKGLDEAELWDGRYKQAIENAGARSVKIKARKFL